MKKYFGLILLGLLSSCTNTTKELNEIAVAEVGSSILYLSEIKENIPYYLWELDSTKAIEDYSERWVKQQILIQEAIRLGLNKNPQIANRIQKLTNDIISESLKDMIYNQSIDQTDVSMDEVRRYYETNRSQFVLEERYIRVRHLITATLSESRNAKEDLMRGVLWPDVVNRYALNKAETLRNETRYFPVSQALRDVPVMQDYIRGIGMREISAIRAFNNQYHFIQIIEERPKGDHPDLEWVLDKIKEWLIVEKRRKFLSNFEQNLLLKAEANNEITYHNVYNQ